MVTEFLKVYRATPHATTGLSPLLHGGKMRTRLNVLSPPLASKDTDALRLSFLPTGKDESFL